MPDSAARLSRVKIPTLILSPGALPLPPASESETVGETLCLALRRCFEDRRQLMLFRTNTGTFRSYLFRRDEQRRIHLLEGSLIEVLRLEPSSAPPSSEPIPASAGIPTSGSAASSAGALLIALFSQAEHAQVNMRLEFRPWSPAHLRYRLDFGGSRYRDGHRVLGPFVHGSSTEDALLAGLQFFHALRAKRT